MRTFNKIVEEVLQINQVDFRDDLTSEDVPNWGSINYLLFISELEKEFDVSFTMDEVLGSETLGAVKEVLKAKGVVL